MRLVRSNSIKSEDVGIDRQVTVGLHKSRKNVVVTRYFTDEEKSKKEAEAKAQGKSIR